MSFSWRTYLDLANELVSFESESHYRAAISRAYYSVYNVLRIRAGYSNRDPKSNHKNFINSLKNPTDKLYYKFSFQERSDLVMIGNELDYLREGRNEADYDSSIIIKKSKCILLIKKVERIFEMLDEADELIS